MDLLSLFFAPIQPFIAHPERIAAVATIFIVMSIVLKMMRGWWPWPLLWSAGAWAAFAIWEQIMVIQGANIRVDLFLIYPLLLGMTVWGLWAGLRAPKRQTVD